MIPPFRLRCPGVRDWFALRHITVSAHHQSRLTRQKFLVRNVYIEFRVAKGCAESG